MAKLSMAKLALIFITVVSCLLFVSCNDPAETLPELPETKAPATLLFWDEGETLPRVLVAKSVKQLGSRDESAVFNGVSLRMPLQDGEVILTTDRAEFKSEDSGLVLLNPPVRFTGSFQGYPVMGRALGARIELADTRLILDDVVWMLAGQEAKVDRLTVRDNWQRREAKRPRSQPSPAAFAAAHAALPQPLAFPAWRRSVESVE